MIFAGAECGIQAHGPSRLTCRRAKPLTIAFAQAHEGGAEDTRSPDASRLPGVSELREASGVRAASAPLSDGGNDTTAGRCFCISDPTTGSIDTTQISNRRATTPTPAVPIVRRFAEGQFRLVSLRHCRQRLRPALAWIVSHRTNHQRVSLRRHVHVFPQRTCLSIDGSIGTKHVPEMEIVFARMNGEMHAPTAQRKPFASALGTRRSRKLSTLGFPRSTAFPPHFGFDAALIALIGFCRFVR